MVGVPGKSKGCTTCRRRKIRCTLEEPACRKCTQSGRQCEGYARFPVFLNRTIQGPEKRHGLEEAKPPTLATNRGPSPVGSSDIGSQRDQFERRRAGTNLHLLPQPSTSAVWDTQLISQFWHIYVPLSGQLQGSVSPCSWLQQIVSQPSPGAALQISLKAFTMTRLGYVTRDGSLRRQGNVNYVRALQAVQKDLWRADTSLCDEVFVAGYILAMYELFESTTKSVAGLNSHISGLSKLALARGPHRHSSPMTLSTFEEFRASAMIQCIQFRKASFLGNDEWKTAPWQLTTKDIYQKLLDRGFDLAALLEEMDSTNLQSLNSKVSNFSSYLQSLSGMDLGMEHWYQDFLQEGPKPLYWESRPSSQTPSSTPGNPPLDENIKPCDRPILTFPSFHIANTLVSYWALRTVLSNTIALTCSVILSNSNDPHPRFADAQLDLKRKAQFMLSRHGDAARMELATSIMRAMPYCVGDNMGILGTQKSLFPLRVAMFSLRRHPGQLLEWTNAIYQHIYDKTGLRYAHEIAILSGGPQAPSPNETSRDSTLRAAVLPDPGDCTRKWKQAFQRRPPDVDEAFLTMSKIDPAIARANVSLMDAE